ncbi:30S ribosomal protein S5 [Mycoplasmopsis californica]|uniref:Small ribosomal subunit protein uS5 n=1 Tax=Mycoplasmopsis equigenitalium TaxID=114883 RepID=A0ABY5J1K9_9BACT|nr:30S ribosomal protein S5 [Mycoplasmopsis equigenitalium]VEU69597.1 30S ribosomal protein S5 [Mycoplasmopsis californica]
MEEKKEFKQPAAATKVISASKKEADKNKKDAIVENHDQKNEKSATSTRTPRAPRDKQRDTKPQLRKKNDNEFSEKVIDIARVTKVVKGGRNFSFSAFVVVGNKKGSVGYGHGKSKEVPDAIKKAVKDARNHLVEVPLIKNKTTIPHEITSKFLSSKVILKPAPKGKGIIASGSVRAVVELAGYSDIVTKTYGSRSKANVVKATLKALKMLRTPEQIAALRDKKLEEII